MFGSFLEKYDLEHHYLKVLKLTEKYNHTIVIILVIAKS